MLAGLFPKRTFLIIEVPAKLLKTGEIVIPGKRGPAPHGVQGEARPGIQDFRIILDSGFRRNDGVSDFCKNLMVKI